MCDSHAIVLTRATALMICFTAFSLCLDVWIFHQGGYQEMLGSILSHENNPFIWKKKQTTSLNTLTHMTQIKSNVCSVRRILQLSAKSCAKRKNLYLIGISAALVYHHLETKLSTGVEGHTERDGKREKRAVVCHCQWDLC